MRDYIILINDKEYFKEIEENPANSRRGGYPTINLFVGAGLQKNKIVTTKNRDEAYVIECDLNLKSYLEQILRNMDEIQTFKVIKVKEY